MKYIHLEIHLIKQYLFSPFSWVIAAIYFFLTSYIFAIGIEQTQAANLNATIWWAAFYSLFLIPIHTMNLFQKRGKADFYLLLRTLRFNPYIIFILYFTFIVSCFLFLNTIIGIQFSFIYHYSSPDTGQIFASLLALFLLQSAYIAISLFCSALLDKSEQAFFCSLAIYFCSWMFFYSTKIFTNTLEPFGIFLTELSLYKHFFTMLNGYFYLNDLLIPTFYIFLSIFFGGLVLKK
ncbi:MAG: hypothetical protein COB02_15555 [Candidatus Cloacimonadota bacterium]|nr:MAG: hypothetical protein COB02_15555 [Candidatus Cloacimonadota bacterium]